MPFGRGPKAVTLCTLLGDYITTRIENFDKLPATGPYDYGISLWRMYPSDEKIQLAAGPKSVLRADPDPAVANPEDRQ